MRRRVYREPVERSVYDGLTFAGTVLFQPSSGSWAGFDEEGQAIGIFPEAAVAGRAVLANLRQKLRREEGGHAD